MLRRVALRLVATGETVDFGDGDEAAGLHQGGPTTKQLVIATRKVLNDEGAPDESTPSATVLPLRLAPRRALE